MLVIGNNGQAFGLARLNPDGSVDTSFGGGDGLATASFGLSPYFDSMPETLVLQPDGRILVAGHASTDNGSDFALARFNTDGSLDQTFGGGDGLVTTDFSPGTSETLTGLALQPDGKIIAVGTSLIGPDFTRSEFAMARYNMDGSLDTTFGGGDGLVTTILSTRDQARRDAAAGWRDSRRRDRYRGTR